MFSTSSVLSAISVGREFWKYPEISELFGVDLLGEVSGEDGFGSAAVDSNPGDDSRDPGVKARLEGSDVKFDVWIDDPTLTSVLWEVSSSNTVGDKVGYSDGDDKSGFDIRGLEIINALSSRLLLR